MVFKIVCVLLPIVAAMTGVYVDAPFWLLLSGTVTAGGFGLLFLTASTGRRQRGRNAPHPLPPASQKDFA